MKKFTIFLALLSCSSILMAAATEKTDSKQVTCGQTVTLTPTADAGYHFLKWSDDNTDNPRIVTISSETDIWNYEAIFEADSYTLTVAVRDIDGETPGSVEKTSISGGYNEQVTVKAIESDDCYSFKQWESADGTVLSIDKEYSYTVLENATVYAVFDYKPFNLNVKSTHGTIQIDLASN